MKSVRPVSFATALQRAGSAEAALALPSQHPDLSPPQAVALLTKLALVTPKASTAEHVAAAAAARSDPRLSALLTATCASLERLEGVGLCDLLWALAVLRRPLQPAEGSFSELSATLAQLSPDLDVHHAAQAAWAWSSMRRDGVGENILLPPPPSPLVARAATLPFAVHVNGCAADRLGTLDALLSEV